MVRLGRRRCPDTVAVNVAVIVAVLGLLVACSSDGDATPPTTSAVPTGGCAHVSTGDVEATLSTTVVSVAASGATCLVELADGEARVSVVESVPEGGLDALFDGPSSSIEDAEGEAAVSTENVALDVRAAVRRGGTAVVVDLTVADRGLDLLSDQAVALATVVAEAAPEAPVPEATSATPWCTALAGADDLATAVAPTLDVDAVEVTVDPASGNCTVAAGAANVTVTRIQVELADPAALDAAGGPDAIAVEVADGGRYVPGVENATITGSLYVLVGDQVYQLAGTGPAGAQDALAAVAGRAVAG